ncbi:energy-coupling factor transporter transmembrane protein EcfT [Tetragenococcus koreensis]|uniref:energy-coupling factor transporter transmembrane component T family protein n=1 Tax=Tetragenococcus koreensis TaxID=290335 RepID=UPI001F3FCB4B|nr:energy-coupling factor transporter transmembrane component T [Tetragenococcus koreensis]MCF1585308.1 energy-coupling factor transporter transmembrane protein EcfT [Tetragenococcus koreensis]MCF1614885.1 energy-coupling factor transporter transmembrane protein EcfT [Tetragenococcus koreensis]MCF1618892.1 energy-coupling factor transporter transmembrane protein EcfT [Tetragenococcus koreensis]MCF1624720.1 energy-coupling factor transporter transmembrane protein EcfT [Tetragenococcus koreensis]
MAFHFDPRTVLFLLLISQIILFLDISIFIEVITVIILVVPFFISKQFKWGLRIGIVYSLQLFIAFIILPNINNAVLLYPLSMVANGFRELIPGMIVGIYAIKLTHSGEWISLFKKWHFPKFFIVPFSVIFRFFPTAREDYRQIRNAMAFRGIERGPVAFIKQPIQTFEFILIPLLMNASQVAQDLTISALTKGLSIPEKQTSIINLRMTKIDFIYMVIALVPIIICLGGLF